MSEHISRHPDDLSGTPEEVGFGQGVRIEVGETVFTQIEKEKYRTSFAHSSDIIPIPRGTSTALVASFDTLTTVSQPRGALDIAVGGRLGGERSPWGSYSDLISALRTSAPDSVSGIFRASNLTKEGSFSKSYVESEKGKAEIEQALETLVKNGYIEAARTAKQEALFAALEVADTHLLIPESPLARIGQPLDRIIEEGAVYYIPQHGKKAKDVLALRVSVFGWPNGTRATLALVRQDKAGYDTSLAGERRSRVGKEFPYRVTTISADAWNAAPDHANPPTEFWDMSEDPNRTLEAMGARFEEIRGELGI